LNWVKFITRRLAALAATLLLLSVLIFFIMEVVPGDVAQMILGRNVTESSLAVLRQQLGLDRPAPVRYWEWLTGFLTGDLGVSISLHAPIGSILMRRTGHSLVLGFTAAIIGLPLAVILGFVAALHRPRWLDALLSRGTVVISSLPEFLIAMLLVLLFSQVAGWFPATAAVRSGSPLDDPRVLVLPVTTLVLTMTAYVLRVTRASVKKTLDAEFVVAAEMKQLPLATILWRHVAPNALLPTITLVAGHVGWLIGGLIVVEAVFAYPGLGLLILTAAKNRDVPLLEATVLLAASFRIIANLGADILYRVVDPRVRLS